VNVLAAPKPNIFGEGGATQARASYTHTVEIKAELLGMDELIANWR